MRLCVYCLHAFIAYVMRAIDTPLTYLLTYLQHLTVLLICGSWACSCFSTFCIWLDRLSQSTTCLWFVLHISICCMITFTSVTASLYFDCCSLLVPLRIGGWVGLGNVFSSPQWSDTVLDVITPNVKEANWHARSSMLIGWPWGFFVTWRIGPIKSPRPPQLIVLRTCVMAAIITF